MIGPKNLGIADILFDLVQVWYSLNCLDETFLSYAEALEIFRIYYGNKYLKIAKCLGLFGCLCDGTKMKFLNTFNTLKKPLMCIGNKGATAWEATL